MIMNKKLDIEGEHLCLGLSIVALFFGERGTFI